jgi:hypothetical protein
MRYRKGLHRRNPFRSGNELAGELNGNAKESSSFLKKRTKKLLLAWLRAGRVTCRRVL